MRICYESDRDTFETRFITRVINNYLFVRDAKLVMLELILRDEHSNECIGNTFAFWRNFKCVFDAANSGQFMLCFRNPSHR